MANVCPICNGEITDGAATCPTCGYHALDATQSFAPLHVDGTTVETPEPVSQSYVLRVVRGPQTGVDIALEEGVLTIGRDPRSDIFLNDMTVSRNHAQFEVDSKGCVLRDCNSFNGVWVNDRLVEACLLKPGDMIQIGAFCLVYRAKA